VPEASWTFSDEVLSTILLTVQNFAIFFANINRKKGTAAIKPLKYGDQLQPEYVRQAKERVRAGKEQLVSREEFDRMIKKIDDELK
jgi:hypothetical protein